MELQDRCNLHHQARWQHANTSEHGRGKLSIYSEFHDFLLSSKKWEMANRNGKQRVSCG
jgi:hypothetical protein